MRKNLFKSIVLSIIFLIAGNAANAQLSYRCTGDNILDGVAFDTGSCYYAPGWTPSKDYTAAWENDEFSIHLGSGTGEEYQAQFRFVADKLITFEGGTGKDILVSFDIEVDTILGFEIQIKDSGDATFAITPTDYDLEPGIHTINHLISVDEGSHDFQILFFAFKWVKGVANIKISNVTICNEYEMEMGSIMGKAVPMYPIRDGETTGTADASTLDFKVVTKGEKTWAWTNWEGKTIAGNAWSSQYRFYTDSANTATDTTLDWKYKGEHAWIENTLTGRVTETQQTYGSTTITPFDNPATITFVQEENNVFFETGDIEYNYSIKNSADESDLTAPVLETAEILNQTSSEVTLSLSATDNSENFFYYIEDNENNFLEISFINEAKFTIKDSTNYRFVVYAMDFSGNSSEAKYVVLFSSAAVYVTEGIANENSFKLDSRSGKLVIEGTAVGEPFGDAYAKVSIDGNWVTNMVGTAKEWKPAGIDATTGVPVYVLQIPASEIPGWEEGKILTLDLGYITAPINNEWERYVSPNLYITEGENAGQPILHEIGTGVDIETAIEDVIIAVPSSLFKVYCANGVLSVKGEATPSNMTLYNIAGQKVLEVKNANSANVSNLRRGAYILKIRTNSGSEEVHKVIL